MLTSTRSSRALAPGPIRTGRRDALEAWIRARIHAPLLRGSAAGRLVAVAALDVKGPPPRFRAAERILIAIADAEADRIRIRNERDAIEAYFGQDSDPYRFMRRKLQTATMRRLRALRRAVRWRKGEW